MSAHRIDVDGRGATYCADGDGPPVVFLHGWALGARAYQRAVRRLTRRGCRVFAPVLPGFAGTRDLPGDDLSMHGYSKWVDDFMRTVGIDEPALVTDTRSAAASPSSSHRNILNAWAISCC
jgi:pimeloyl-ACP methyl ester carboxylesterase